MSTTHTTSAARVGQEIGRELHDLARELFPICRSITGDGVRRTLRILQRELPGLQLHEVPSGTRCFDWTVPAEWNIRDAYILDPSGARIVDFRENNLHVVSYSTAVDRTMSLEELQPHLHSLPERPRAIPYLTSYYAERWGFCLAHEQRTRLKPGDYRVVIDSTLEPGSLTYGELLIPGESEREILLSTYVCHPSMGNNELSGPVMATALARELLGRERLQHSVRVIFIPETIGSLVYLSRHLDRLRRHVVAGFNLTCVGDDRAYSYLPSRAENTLADRVALHVLTHTAPGFKRYSYLDRGSDERQYCSPGADLPVVSVMRTKYGEYPEYHTSDDDLTLITPSGLAGAYRALLGCLDCLERNRTLRVTVVGEPQLGRRGLYPALSTRETKSVVATMMNLIAYCDGTRDLLAVADKIGEPMWALFDLAERLESEGVLERCPGSSTGA